MIQLTLPYPVSANAYWSSRVVKSKKTGKSIVLTFVTDEARAFKAEVAGIASRAGIAKPLEGRLSVLIRVFPHRPLDWQTRMRKLGALWADTVQCIDMGNAEKTLSDALQGIVYVDDKRIWDLRVVRQEPDAYGARTEVLVNVLAIEQPQASLIAEAA